MTFNPQSSIVRILNRKEETVGTGFFARDKKKIITCAHVVEYAEAGPGETVNFICLKEPNKVFTARVLEDGWRQTNEEDIAILEPDAAETFGENVGGAAFGLTFNAVGKTLHTYGFPRSMSELGLHAECSVLGSIQQNGRVIFQLRSREITFGFSGAPVWDSATGLVLGMVVSMIPDDQDAGKKYQQTAFITPIETVREVFKEFSLVEVECPYRGLDFFEEQDKSVYFGRDRVITNLINLWAQNNLVTLVGVSGSGKSSLIRAGLAKGLETFKPPELYQKKRILFQNYDQTPFPNLLKVIANEKGDAGEIDRSSNLPDGSLDGSINEPEKTTVDISEEQEPAELARLLATALAVKENSLLILDQFERIFTDVSDHKKRSKFIRALLLAAENDTKILLSLRADYYAKFLSDPDFSNAFKTRIDLSPMTREELVSTIELPAKSLGREVEKKLSDVLVEDVFGRPGDLPLLEFALQEIWKTDAAGGVLTFETYEQLGYEDNTGKISGVRSAIIRRAEEVWQKLKNKGKEKIAERIFLSLVTPTEQSEKDELILGADASRRARLSEFDEESEKVINELANSFLLTASKDIFTGQPIIEISHEALIQHWTRLHRLTQINYHFLKWYVQDFIPYFQRWLDEKKPFMKKRLLLPEVILQEAKQWEKVNREFFTGPRSEYIARSARKQKYKRVYQSLIAAAAVAALVFIFFGWHSRNESRGNELHERGVQALLKQDYQQAQLLLAESLTYNDSDDTREHLLESRVNGALVQSAEVLPGNLFAASDRGEYVAYIVTDGSVKVRARGQSTEKNTGFNIAPADSKRFRAAIDAGGEFMVLGDMDGTVRLWDLNSNQPIRANLQKSEKEDKSSSGIDSLAISPDKNLIAYGNMDGNIYLWDRRTNESRTLKGHSGAIHCLAFSANGDMLGSGGADFSARIWKIAEKKEKSIAFYGHEDFITTIAFSPSSEFLASGAADGSIRLWDAKSNEAKPELYMLIGHLGAVRTVNFNPNSSLIVSGSEDKTIRVWDTSIRKQILMLGTYNKRGIALAAFIKNDHVISGNEDGAIKVWEIGRRPEGQAFYNSSAVTAVSFYPDNQKLVFGDSGGQIQIWDVNNHEISTLTNLKGESVNCLAVRPTDGLLAVGRYDGSVLVWDPRTQSEQPAPPKISKPVWGIAFHPTRPLLAYGGQDKMIHVWNLQTGREDTAPLSTDNSSVWSISFSFDGLYLSSGGGDGKIRIWDAASFQQLNIFDPKGDELWAVPFGPSNKTLISAGLDRKVQIWSFQDILGKPQAEPQKTWIEHEGIIQSAAISNDWIATASADHTVRLWNLNAERNIKLELHDRPVWWVSFSQDGKLLASGGIDRRVRISSMDSINHVFTASVSDLLAQAKKQTCLDLNQNEEVVFGGCRPN